MSRRMFRSVAVCAVALGAFGAAAAVAACSSSSTSSTGTSTDASTRTDTSTSTGSCTTSATLKIHFAPMYSAFVTDSTAHQFVVPAIVTGSGGKTETATWSASDSSAVAFAADSVTGGTQIALKKAPASPLTITAQVGSLCTSTELTVTSAVNSDWQTGSQRYNNGVAVIPGCVGQKVKPLLVEAGIPYQIPAPPDAGCPDAGPACTGCHGSSPTGGFFAGVQHTPEQTAGFTDQQLIDIFANGKDPSYDIGNLIPYNIWQAFHVWSDIKTPAEQKAMVVYLRSLAPQPDTAGGVNFGVLADAGVTMTDAGK